TPEPTAAISPATSSPRMSGAPGGGGYLPLRCRMSGRLTPAARTRISTSPGPGSGRSRRPRVRADASPAPPSISITRMWGPLHKCGSRRSHRGSVGRSERETAMVFEDLEPRPARGATLVLLGREDLDDYAVEELEARIAALEAEIVRVRAALDHKKSRKSAADALFNFKD